ncbi:TonB-dependent receptor plug domain-containing protein [Sphingomicrobium arenosum]|uniref:TonB-dependent receptor plug domain-containing protein n=1 Tax=Sphingomicrobium arenosum TaxID=2233861 RepID=UPI002241055B|nr:TonB-dependent receptor [Sphingomicrobium arenosum]
MTRFAATVSLLPLLLAPLAAPASAAESAADARLEEASTIEGSLITDNASARDARVYTLADLAQYAPQTALDMVNRIPGFSVDGGNQGNRGLGQASQNILLNGERVAGKSNDAITTLQRIDARKVSRIEILDGATLDVPGLSGEVANIVYDATTISGTWRYQAQIRPRIEDTFLDGSVNLSGGSLTTNWSLSLSNNSYRSGNWGPETVISADGDLLLVRDELGRFDGDRPRIAGSYSKTFANGNELNLNGAGELYFARNKTDGLVSPVGEEPFEERYRSGEDEWNLELGGDYAFDLGGGRLRLIALQRNEHSPTYSDFRVIGEGGSRYEQVVDENESILRGEYGWKRGSADWEVSLEGAYNSLGSSATLDVFDTLDTVRTDLPGNDIEELRSEAILSLSRPLSDALSLQLNGGAEYSRISATGVDSRAYFRPKGSAAMSWRQSPDLTVNAKVERIVDQLNFFSFLAAVDVVDGSDRESNNSIVPQERWRGRLEAVTKLGAWGNITPYVQLDRIENVIESIPISPTEEALGNAGNASAIVYGLDGTLLFAPLGVKGARLDIHAHRGDSSFVDPLLLTRRELNGNEFEHVRLSLRHDIPDSQLAWGGSINWFEFGYNYRLDQQGRSDKPRPDLEMWVQHKDVFGMQATVGLWNLLDNRDDYERIVYVDRRDGPIDYVETRKRGYGRIVAITLTGSF